MRVVFIVRSTLFTVPGGDTVQVQETARELHNEGVEADIKGASEKIDYEMYDLLHFFNIIRPADILVHIERSGKPFVVSTILVDYSTYDKQQRSGLAGKLFRLLPAGGIEYTKSLYRFLMRRDKLASLSYLWKGHNGSINEILTKAKAVLVQAQGEYDDLVKLYHTAPAFSIIHNGVNTAMFQERKKTARIKNLVLCVARIEGIKNQYNLIRALNNTAYQLVLIGNVAPNQKNYYQKCRNIAAANVSFINHLPQQQLIDYYATASVHILPSWFEVCGLSSLEAAVMGCQVVITDNGYARSYFKDDAFYCDPAKPESILQSVDSAMTANDDGGYIGCLQKIYIIKQTLNIAIIGTRGIPNHYGGFEQVAQYLSAGLLNKGHRVTVYNSHDHPYKQKEWKGVQIIHCYDAEKSFGTAGQFVYDLNCIRNAGKKNFDVILFLGYTSSSVWGRLFPKNAIIISNMDGMEWKRSKYSAPVRKFLLYAEKLAVKYSHHLIADSTAVQVYLYKKYSIQSRYIPYGAEIIKDPDENVLRLFGLKKHNYYMLMARMEPENNIDMILAGFCKTGSDKIFIVVGNMNNSFGTKMLARYGKDRRLIFAGPIFEETTVNALRAFSKLYFHGHSVGGTNPSLLEAMASMALIAAHDNEFNRAVLQNDAFYFKVVDEVSQLIDAVERTEQAAAMISSNLKKIKDQFNWPAITDEYEKCIIDCYNKPVK
jgi:glycosyltransferase involved in cell wall biosynthesis